MAIEKKLIIDVDLIIEKYNKDNPKLQPMTRTTLSKQLGVNKQVFSDWKNGRTPQLIIRIFELMEIADCQIHYFIIEKELK